ncbi:hypothetical protein [Mycobacterium simulans]|uniref:hypothetical protein n=1 Tax=Mycobacterium simulans TaxID=627089 RepID=UPI00163EF93D|nr:hypothetical protein [Mycobacterium simulans]
MDDWAEAELAWKLADALSPAFPAAERAQLYAVLGSGDSYAAITTVLRAALPLPATLITELRAWLYAYQHSDDAPHLHELLRAVPPV